MRITVLAFHPESIELVEQRLTQLLPGAAADLELDVVYPSLELGGDEDVWAEDVAADLEARLAKLRRPMRVLHVAPGNFVEELFGPRPPSMVVVAYTHFSERVAVTANMLATRNFPTMMLGYRP